jgi:hypothetical protein
MKKPHLKLHKGEGSFFVIEWKWILVGGKQRRKMDSGACFEVLTSFKYCTK